MLPKLLGATTRSSRPQLVAEVRSLILPNPPDGVRRGILRLRGRPDATAVLPRIGVPTLVLVGEEDEVTPPKDARALATAIPQATLETLPGAGHLSNLEAPSRFNAALHRFLATV
jgi:3-oxoadipate enol-lactonase